MKPVLGELGRESLSGCSCLIAAHSDTSVTITAPDRQKEKWKSFAWISGVVSSGRKEQGQDYVITGFTGLVYVNGERGEWEAAPSEIKRIRFVDGK